MTQYHINPETLRTNKCSAQIKCKFKGSKHFSNESDARAYRDEMMKDQSVPAVLKKSSPSSDAMVGSALTALKSVGAAEADDRACEAYKKIPVVPTKVELDQELHDVETELYGYGVAELLSDRGFDHVEVASLEKRGFSSVTLKVPGYYEVDISTDLARRELGMPARTPTVKDNTPLRQAEIAMLEARRNSTGMFESIDAAKAAERAYREAADKFRLLKKEARNN